MASGLIGASNSAPLLGGEEEDALVPEMPLKIEELKKYEVFKIQRKGDV